MTLGIRKTKTNIIIDLETGLRTYKGALKRFLKTIEKEYSEIYSEVEGLTDLEEKYFGGIEAMTYDNEFNFFIEEGYCYVRIAL